MEQKSNEALARLIQSGQRNRLLELLAQVRRFAMWRVRRWARLGRGVTVDDLEQEAFIALQSGVHGGHSPADTTLPDGSA